MAGILSGLKLSKAERKVGAVSDPVAKARKKFVEGIDVQLALSRDSDYTVSKTKYVDGKATKASIKPRAWWWYASDGDVKLQVKYGSKTLMLDGKNPTVEVGDAKGLTKTLELIKKAAEAKELDDAIVKLAQRSGRKK